MTNGDDLPLCASADLVERGLAVLFNVRLWGEPARAFALRFDGRVVAYLNRCAHVPTELDWQAGEFLDGDRRWIVCSIHGATYEPANGRCLWGPCKGAGLIPVDVTERDGQVFWRPRAEVQPPLPAQAPSPPPAA